MSPSESTIKQQRALLVILLATCERALEAFTAADNPLDESFVTDLERIVTRTEQEIEALGKPK